MNAFLEKQLSKRIQNNSYRQLRPVSNLIDFSSNDYLGFARSPELYKFIKDYEHRYENLLFPGAGASRLISGNHELYGMAEKRVAGFHKADRALIFNSGYDANLGLFSCIATRHDTILYDEFVHASIRDGIRLSLAKSYSFKHNDLADFKKKLSYAKQKAQGKLIVAVESVYSMDGINRIPQNSDRDEHPKYRIEELIDYCHQKGIYVIVDEAHSTGVYGQKGEGLLLEKNLHEKVFARVHTFGKALGVHGAAVLGSELLINYLINFARSFIYTTALPPHSLLSILAAYDYLEDHPETINKLRENIQYFSSKFYSNDSLPEMSSYPGNDSAIHYKIIGNNKKCLELASKCQKSGYDVRAILSPTVPENSERLRICLHAFNTHQEIDELLHIPGVME